MALGERDRPKVSYHFNEPTTFGYQELKSSEEYTDYEGKVRKRTIARFYSRHMVDMVKGMLKQMGVYKE
jgi:hypothetical protein